MRGRREATTRQPGKTDFERTMSTMSVAVGTGYKRKTTNVSESREPKEETQKADGKSTQGPTNEPGWP